MAKKKKIVTTSAESKTNKGTTVKVKKVASSTLSTSSSSKEMTFGRETFKWMGIGVAFMALGYILMIGGHQEDPNVWDPNVIYNWRILVLAPILILTGLGIQIYAIFKK